jgi:hypothetical protein
MLIADQTEVGRVLSAGEKDLLMECINSSTLELRGRRNLLSQLEFLRVEDKFYCEENKGRVIKFVGYNENNLIKACEVGYKKNKKLVLEVDLPTLRIMALSVRNVE